MKLVADRQSRYDKLPNRKAVVQCANASWRYRGNRRDPTKITDQQFQRKDRPLGQQSGTLLGGDDTEVAPRNSATQPPPASAAVSADALLYSGVQRTILVDLNSRWATK